MTVEDMADGADDADDPDDRRAIDAPDDAPGRGWRGAMAALGLVLVLAVAALTAPAVRAGTGPAAQIPVPVTETPPVVVVIPAGSPEATEAETEAELVQVAMLETATLLYGLAREAARPDGPELRRYLLLSGFWLGLFILLVAGSAGARERRATLRRRRSRQLYR